MMGSTERGDWTCEEEAIAQRMARIEADDEKTRAEAAEEERLALAGGDEFLADDLCHGVNPHCPVIEVSRHRGSHDHSASGMDWDIEVVKKQFSGLKCTDLQHALRAEACR